MDASGGVRVSSDSVCDRTRHGITRGEACRLTVPLRNFVAAGNLPANHVASLWRRGAQTVNETNDNRVDNGNYIDQSGDQRGHTDV